MTIQYCSDLHLEFRENRKYLLDNPIEPTGEILLLAGDIVPFALMNQHAEFFDFVSDHFETTYWVPGNHEYYHADLSDRSGTIHEKIRSNVFLVNNVSVTQSKIRFVFSTLWSNIGPVNQRTIKQGMADFHLIKYKGKPFTPEDFNRQHHVCKAFLENELSHKIENTVVATHHVPTFMNYPEKYRGDELNEAFAVELFDLITTSGANYWVYGHHHQPIPEFDISNTRLVNNQLGYVRYNEHRMFK